MLVRLSALLVFSTFFLRGVLAADVVLISLTEAEHLWQKHSRELRLARISVTGAEADVVAANAAPNPQISFNAASISPQEGFGSGSLRHKRMDSILRVDQLVERGRKRELRAQVASHLLDAARNDSSDTERQQRQALRAAFYDLVLAQGKARILSETAELYGRNLAANEIRYRTGDISGVDRSRLRIEKERADNDFRLSVADKDKAQVALAYLIGREKDAQALRADESWPKIGDVDMSYDLSNRPDVHAATARVAAAENARDLARAQKTRDVTVSAQLEHNLQNPPTNSFGLGVSFPLFVRYGFEGEIARVEADLEAARENLERTQAQAQGEIDQARADLLAATERLMRLEGGMLREAEQVAKSAEFAYSKGAMSLIDLLDARRTWRQVQLEALSVRADYAKAHAAWLAARSLN